MSKEILTHLEGKSVYLSGPMTGIKEWNRASFSEAEKLVKSCGATSVYNPCAYAEAMSCLSHETCMRISIFNLCATRIGAPAKDALTVYDVLVSLPDWEQSAGARLEREVADACGIEVCNLEDAIA
jgi:hypothetical protein